MSETARSRLLRAVSSSFLVVWCLLGAAPVSAAPRNDAFEDPVRLSGGYGRLSGLSLLGATSQAGESHYGQRCGATYPCPSIWFTWNAPASGQLRLSISSRRAREPARLVLYRGRRLARLGEEDAALPFSTDRQTTVGAVVTRGVSYRIAVLGSWARFTLSWDTRPNPCTITGSNRADVIDGTHRADYICAMGGHDVISGRGGNDVVDGGSGLDTVSFRSSPAPVIVRLPPYQWEQSGDAAGSAEGWGRDSFVKVENATGSVFGDAIVGQSGGFATSPYRTGNVLTGGPGGDLLSGGYGSDRLLGGRGQDTLYPGPSLDLAPDQLVDGGAGSDTVSYSPYERFLEARVRDLHVELARNVASMCCGRVDRLASIENATGGPGHDWLVGNGGRNVLRGRAGIDSIYGGRGDDALFGDRGRDYLAGGGGIDRCRRGADGGFLDGCER